MKKNVLLFVLMLLPMVASADPVEINGIYYNLNFQSKIAEVTSRSSGFYTGIVEIPNSISFKGTEYGVTSIGDYAFRECTGLTSVTIPNSVTNIGEFAFNNCTSLISVTIPNSVASIGDYAFSSCSGLTSITIGNSVTSIGSGAFDKCTGLTSVTIPNSVTSIGSGAFDKCTGLTSVTIPNSVTSIGSGAFEFCTSLTSIVVDEGNSTFDSRENCNAIIETSTNTMIVGCKNTIIPNSVVSIGGHAFQNCSGLTSITIPNSVASIGESAFHCTGLTSIVVDEGNSTFDSRENCNAIIETSTNTMIVGCKNTIIPNSVVSIGGHAFQFCSGLTSITIPNSVASIGESAFYGCTGLTSITIPNNVTSIDNWAFSGCTGLTSVTIPNSVTSIGWGAFESCSGLTSITIPNNVTKIGDSAFKDCTGLTWIMSLNQTPPLCVGRYDSFTGVDHTIPVYVPKGSVLKYKAADVWRNFVVFREISDEEEDVLLTISDGGNGKTQLLVDESKPYFTLLFKADNGWKLHSVTFNDDDVTAEVSENGQYTTPALTASSTLTVIYEESSAQSVSAAFKSSVQVRANRGELIVSNPTTSALSVTVYELNGTQVLQQPLTGAETRITLPEGHVYVVNVGNQTFKVGL